MKMTFVSIAFALCLLLFQTPPCQVMVFGPGLSFKANEPAYLFYWVFSATEFDTITAERVTNNGQSRRTWTVEQNNQLFALDIVTLPAEKETPLTINVKLKNGTETYRCGTEVVLKPFKKIYLPILWKGLVNENHP